MHDRGAEKGAVSRERARERTNNSRSVNRCDAHEELRNARHAASQCLEERAEARRKVKVSENSEPEKRNGETLSDFLPLRPRQVVAAICWASGK